MTVVPALERRSWPELLQRVDLPSALLTLGTFAFLFAKPVALLARDWWNNPDAGHGLLLAPLALWLAWRAGVRPDARPNLVLGLAVLVASVLVRYLSGLAAELFTMRLSLLMGAAGLTICYFGVRQILAWWLPFTLLLLSVPIPDVLLNAIALPLQFTASKMGAALLAARHVPVRLDGNVIEIPGHRLFVAEACSGLRSLTALLSLAVLLGGITLRSWTGRLLLVLLAVPVAIVVNGVRVFLSGFLVYFVSPEFGEGFLHLTEGWLLFIVAFAILGGLAFLASAAERVLSRPRVAYA